MQRKEVTPFLLRPPCPVAAQCPIPTQIAMHGNIGENL